MIDTLLGECNALPVPVPPMLEEAFGYTEPAPPQGPRYVMFYWEPCGDELAFDDGRTSVVGANWEAFLLFTDHEKVAPATHGYNFGHSDGEAQHGLLLDRADRRLYAGPARTVRAILHQQYGIPDVPGEPFVMSDEQLEAFARDFASGWTLQTCEVTEEEIDARMAAREARLDNLARWLDESILAPSGAAE